MENSETENIEKRDYKNIQKQIFNILFENDLLPKSLLDEKANYMIETFQIFIETKSNSIPSALNLNIALN